MQNQRFRVQQRLKACVNKKAGKLGLSLTPACMMLMEKMITNGISRLESQRVLEKEEQLWFAEQNLSKYISNLSNNAQEAGTYPISDENIFDTTIKSTGPLWPFS